MKPHSRGDNDSLLSEKFIYILLDVVNNNGSLRRLKRQGISFSDIARLTDLAIEKKFVAINERKELVLTVTGLKLLDDIKPKFKNTNKEEWIDFAKKSKIGKLDKNSIFVPSQNELTFRLK